MSRVVERDVRPHYTLVRIPRSRGNRRRRACINVPLRCGSGCHTPRGSSQIRPPPDVIRHALPIERSSSRTARPGWHVGGHRCGRRDLEGDSDDRRRADLAREPCAGGDRLGVGTQLAVARAVEEEDREG